MPQPPRASRRQAGPGLASPDPAEDRIRPGRLDHYLGFNLCLAQEASFQAFARRTGWSSLRPGRFAVLVLIGENPGISQTALGAAAGRDKSTLTPALADLERRGLLHRRRAAHDRRSYALSLTEAGEAALRELSVHAAAHDRQLDELVGLENKDAFMATLRRIITGLG